MLSYSLGGHHPINLLPLEEKLEPLILGAKAIRKAAAPVAIALSLGLVADGAAAKAGLHQGDRVVTINGGIAFKFTREQLTELMATPKPIAFKIERGEKRFELEITPQRVAGASAPKARPASAQPNPAGPLAPRKATRGLPLGVAAPAIDGEDMDGNSIKLADYRGKVTVVTFWGFC